MWRRETLTWGEIVRYSSVSLSPTLGRNEKVEQHIRKKTRKPNALRFWVEGGVITLYVVWLSSFSFLWDLPGISPSNSPNIGLRPGRVQFDPVSKVFLMMISGKRVPYKCVNGGTSEGSWVMYSDSHLRGRLLDIQVWVEVPHWVGMRKLSNI